MIIFQKSADVRKNFCGHMQFTSMPNLSLSPKCLQQKNTKSEFYTSFCGRPQANLHRAADVRKKIAPADTEKCPQKSAGFDRGTDICGFVANICGHTPTSAMIYAEVRICPQHMPDLLRTFQVRVVPVRVNAPVRGSRPCKSYSAQYVLQSPEQMLGKFSTVCISKWTWVAVCLIWYVK